MPPNKPPRYLVVWKEPAIEAEGLTCPHYKPMEGSRRCVHYWDGGDGTPDADYWPDLEGACDRDDEFMCVFWLARYPYAYVDPRGRVHRVDVDGVVHITPQPQSKSARTK